MKLFKVGDRVILVDIKHKELGGNLEGLTLNKTYYIVGVRGQHYNLVQNDEGDIVALFPSRFILDVRQNTKLDELL